MTNLRNTTIREPTNENQAWKQNNANEAKVRAIEIELINPDKNYPLIWDIKEMIYSRFNIPIDVQMMYNGDGVLLNDLSSFKEWEDMKQPFRLNFSKSKVLLLWSICSLSDSGGESKDSIFVETYETWSVYNLSKIIFQRTKIDASNMVFYNSR